MKTKFEGNAIISIFMGYTMGIIKRSGKIVVIFSNDATYPGHYKTLREFDYHNNFESLIPVVEKLKEKGWHITMKFYRDSYVRIEKKNKAFRSGGRGKKMIDMLYEAVVNCILWENEANK